LAPCRFAQALVDAARIEPMFQARADDVRRLPGAAEGAAMDGEWLLSNKLGPQDVADDCGLRPAPVAER
jgi:hypothetical protein